MEPKLDAIDQIIVEGLKDYVNVKNAALKDERKEGKYIIGGNLKQSPLNPNKFETGLSLGITAMNEAGGESFAAPIPDSAINREIYNRLVQHFKGRTNHGLRSSLAKMGLQSSEKTLFTITDRQANPELFDRTARRAADRAMELIAGRQRTAGYPITSIPIVGGHQIGRATSEKIGFPEQILFDNNMEIEGKLEGQVRKELRGKKASKLAGKKLINFLASEEVDAKTANDIIEALAIIQKGD